MKIVQNNKDEILRLVEQASDYALWSIGAEMEANAKKYETRVDTGRLRNSISHAETDDTVYVGTNVEYAPIHELGGRKISALHFLQRSVSNHIDRYKAILEASLKE
jgi:phage gpG-like protein